MGETYRASGGKNQSKKTLTEEKGGILRHKKTHGKIDPHYDLHGSRLGGGGVWKTKRHLCTLGVG